VRLPQTTNLGQRRRDLGSAESAYVRARNLLFLSLAAMRLGHAGGRIVIGATGEDAFVDTKTSYFEQVTPLLAGGANDGDIEVAAPIAALSKRDVLRLAELFGIPLELTWSCYRSGRRPCGHCLSCDHLARALDCAAPAPPWRGAGLRDLDEALAETEQARARARAAKALRGPTFLGPLDPLVERPASAAEEAMLRQVAGTLPADSWRPVLTGADLDGRGRTAGEASRTVYQTVRRRRGRARWERRSVTLVDHGLTPARMAPLIPGLGGGTDAGTSYILDLGERGLGIVRRPPVVTSSSDEGGHE